MSEPSSTGGVFRRRDIGVSVRVAGVDVVLAAVLRRRECVVEVVVGVLQGGRLSAVWTDSCQWFAFREKCEYCT